MSWSLRFAEPIVLADGGKLATLRDAIAHLGKAIPKSDHDTPAVLTALVVDADAENGWLPRRVPLRGNESCEYISVDHV